MRIPEVRERLRELAIELQAPELNELADELHRRRLRPARRPRGPALTEQMKREIRLFAEKHPTLRLQDLAEVFQTNQGRIHETLYGVRE